MFDRDKFKSAFGRFMRAMADLLILNLISLFCSLPIITIGPVLCALFSVTLKIVRDEEGEAVRKFFSAFKENFRQGLILGLIGLFMAVVIFADGVYAFSVEGTAKTVFCIVTGIVAAIWLTYISYVFALQAHYVNDIRTHIKNAFLLAFVNPGKTILMWIILAIPVLLILFLPQNVVAYIGSLYLMFGMTLPVFCLSVILRNIFDTFDPEE